MYKLFFMQSIDMQEMETKISNNNSVNKNMDIRDNSVRQWH